MCQFWPFQRLPNSAHYNSAIQIFTCHIWQECHLYLYFHITAYIMGFGLLHLSTYLQILELKIVCPIWYLLSQFWCMAYLCQFWPFQRLSNSAHYNFATHFGIRFLHAISGKNVIYFYTCV